MNDLFARLSEARVYDLSQPLYAGVPHFPTHPPFLMTLNKLHGEMVVEQGGSSAAETITLGGHTGTHIDGLNHFSCDGRLFGGATPRQSPSGGVEPHSMETMAPVIRRGLLFDIARFEKADPLTHDYTLTPEVLNAVAERDSLEVRPGDIVLLRTGWARFWGDPRQYITGGLGGGPVGPGPRRPAAEWISSRRAFAAGSDTVAFERMPSRAMEVHVHLLVESGIHIIENLNLEALAADGVREFLFIAAPLKIRGATGSPVRPFAVVVRG